MKGRCFAFLLQLNQATHGSQSWFPQNKHTKKKNKQKGQVPSLRSTTVTPLICAEEKQIGKAERAFERSATMFLQEAPAAGSPGMLRSHGQANRLVGFKGTR